MRLQGIRRRGYRSRAAQVGETRHFQSLVPTGIDTAKRLQVQTDVDRQPVIARVPAHPDADARKLLPVDINAGSLPPGHRHRASLCGKINDTALESRHQVTDPESGTTQINERIN